MRKLIATAMIGASLLLHGCATSHGAGNLEEDSAYAKRIEELNETIAQLEQKLEASEAALAQVNFQQDALHLLKEHMGLAWYITFQEYKNLFIAIYTVPLGGFNVGSIAQRFLEPMQEIASLREEIYALEWRRDDDQLLFFRIEGTDIVYNIHPAANAAIAYDILSAHFDKNDVLAHFYKEVYGGYQFALEDFGYVIVWYDGTVEWVD